MPRLTPWQPIRVRDRPREGLALLSHSVSDAEAERLAALDRYSILDTPPEQGFEELAQLAASRDAPAAADAVVRRSGVRRGSGMRRLPGAGVGQEQLHLGQRRVVEAALRARLDLRGTRARALHFAVVPALSASSPIRIAVSLRGRA